MSHTAARQANLLGTLSLAVAGHMGAVAEAASPHGGSTPAALVALEGYLGGEPIDALRQVLGLTHSGAVRLVDRLAAGGLAVRSEGADQRTVAVTLTPAGRRAAARVMGARARALEEVLGALGPAERAALTALHEKLLAAVTTDRSSARRLCRLCDPEACGHHRGTCPVTEAVAA